MSIEERIASAGRRLTPTERRIAETVLEDPTQLAFGTVSDLAGRVPTSPPSIVRFAAKLGFNGYADLQRWARAQVANQLATPAQRIRRPEGSQVELGERVQSAVSATLAGLDKATLEHLAGPLVGAERIGILSGETSQAGAHVLLSGLSMIRDGVRLIEQHNFGRDLNGATTRDAVVVFDFARYRYSSISAARALHGLGVPLVAITDSPLSPLSRLTEHRCELEVPAVGPFDSSLTSVLAAELLVLEVAESLGTSVRERIDRLERFWDETGTFHAE